LNRYPNPGLRENFIENIFSLQRWRHLLLKALGLKSTLKKNINVLHHIMGYFKRNLAGDEKQELLTIIDQYGEGYVPLIVPITLIKHYVLKYDQPWLKSQTYLNPHPDESGVNAPTSIMGLAGKMAGSFYLLMLRPAIIS
jgi:uncharacterized protein YbgA (DUF1722 family)